LNGGKEGKLRIVKKGERSQNYNGDEIAQSVLLVEFVALVLLVKVTPTILKEKLYQNQCNQYN
jgi:hypothetical protein